MAAMLSELTKDVQIDPSQGQWPPAVSPEHVIQAEAGCGPARRLARFAVCAADGLDGVLAGEDERIASSWREPEFLTRASGDGFAEPHPFRVNRVLEQAQQRRTGRDEGKPGLFLRQAVKTRMQRGPMLIEERLQLNLEGFGGHVERRPVRSGKSRRDYPPPRAHLTALFCQ